MKLWIVTCADHEMHDAWPLFQDNAPTNEQIFALAEAAGYIENQIIESGWTGPWNIWASQGPIVVDCLDGDRIVESGV